MVINFSTQYSSFNAWTKRNKSKFPETCHNNKLHRRVFEIGYDMIRYAVAKLLTKKLFSSTLGLLLRQVDQASSRCTSAASTLSSPAADGSGDDDRRSPRPVQFSTSPPVDAHRPRGSLSPPPALLFRHLAAAGGGQAAEKSPDGVSGLTTTSQASSQVGVVVSASLLRRHVAM